MINTPKSTNNLFVMRNTPKKQQLLTTRTTSTYTNPPTGNQSYCQQSRNNSFTVWGRIANIPVKTLFDSGSQGNNISEEMFEKLKQHGKYIPATIFTQDIVTAAGKTLNCIGTFVVDIWLGKQTCAKQCSFSIIQGLALDKIVIGSVTISDLQAQQGWFLGKFFHKYPDCPNFGKNSLEKNCTDECMDISECLCVNPFDADKYDIIPFIDDATIECNVLRTQSYGGVPALATVEPTLDERLVASAYCKIPPETAQVIPVNYEEQSWNSTSKEFEFKSKDPADKDEDLRYFEPADGIAHITNMDTKEDAKILRLSRRCCLLVNRSNDMVEIHPNNVVGKLYALQIGKRVKEIEQQHLEQFQKEDIQGKINSHAPGGFSFPKPSGELSFDASYQRSLARHYGYEADKSDEFQLKKTQQSQLPPITIRHLDNNNTVHVFEIECGFKNKTIRKQLTKFLQDRSSVFYSNPDNHPALVDEKGNILHHSLLLKEQALLKAAKPIDLSPPMRKQLHKMIQAKLKNGTMIEIEPEKRGPFNSSVLIVDKPPGPNGEARFRIVQSLLNLNDNTIYKNFALRSPTEIIQDLPPGAKLYSQFDAKDAFDSLALKPSEVVYTSLMYRDDKDIPHTVANTRCPQGAVNSPSSLINTYNRLFRDLIADKVVAWYFDDAISAAVDENQLFENTCKIVDRCHKHNIVLSPNKCRLGVSTVLFGGYEITANRSTIPLKYAQRIVDFKRPNDVSTLMNFLGICCFIKQFVRNYAHYSTVLSNLISECTRKNGGGWNWTEECQTAVSYTHLTLPTIYSV